MLTVAFVLNACTTVTVSPQQQPAQTAATPEPDPIIGMPNPVTEYASYADLLTEMPEISMADAPADSTEVIYQSIDGADGNPEIAEIRFTLDGVDYTYRATVCDSIMKIQDISGLYYDFDVDETVQSDSTGIYIEYAIQYCTPSGIGHTTWFDSDSRCQYDLSGKTTQEDLKKVTEDIAVKDINTNSVQGVISAMKENEITLSMENGNVIKFPCYIATDAKVGDKVILWYSGTVGQDDVMVLFLHVLEAAGEYVGEVMKKDSSTITIANGDVAYVFKFGDTVEITGAKSVKVGDIVSVVYSGELGKNATVNKIDVEVSAPEEPEEDPELIDKTLKGTVTKVHSGKISIVTGKGKKFSFVRAKKTIYSGDYPLEVGCTVRVRYDGYASSTPDAKEIEVLKEAPVITPVPTKKPEPTIYTVSDTIRATNGIWIVLDDGNTYTVNSANCKIHHPENCVIGNMAEITYYESGSEKIAVEARFIAPLY